jgi:Flp pilus assembly protein CpaB
VLTVFLAAIVLMAAHPAKDSETPIPRIQIVSEDDTVDLPTPMRTLAKGESLKNSDFRMIKWPRSKVGNTYLQSLEPHNNFFALTQLPANLPIPITAISNFAPDANAVTEAIPVGMRAITVKVDVESAVEGWARTGNYIDVILVRPSKENALGLESLVIAENIKILSAGATTTNAGNTESAARTPNTVTLLVTQEDALKVKTAANLGRLTFALRGNGDSTPTVAVSIDGRKLLGQQKQESKSAVILGKAKGPDGKTYVLDRDSKWLRSSLDSVGAIESNNVGQE